MSGWSGAQSGAAGGGQLGPLGTVPNMHVILLNRALEESSIKRMQEFGNMNWKQNLAMNFLEEDQEDLHMSLL